MYDNTEKRVTCCIFSTQRSRSATAWVNVFTVCNKRGKRQFRTMEETTKRTTKDLHQRWKMKKCIIRVKQMLLNNMWRCRRMRTITSKRAFNNSSTRFTRLQKETTQCKKREKRLEKAKIKWNAPRESQYSLFADLLLSWQLPSARKEHILTPSKSASNLNSVLLLFVQTAHCCYGCVRFSYLDCSCWCDYRNRALRTSLSSTCDFKPSPCYFTMCC